MKTLMLKGDQRREGNKTLKMQVKIITTKEKSNTIELQAQSSEQSKNHKNMESHMHTCEDAQINHMKILLTKQSIT